MNKSKLYDSCRQISLRRIFSSSLVCFLPVLGLVHTADAQVNTSPYELVEIFRIGDEARGDTIFFSAHEYSVIAVNSLNQMFVGGGWPPVVPVMSFSNKGHLIGLLGAEGEGPGEFRMSGSIVIGPEDSIYVHDPSLELLLVFEPNTLQYVSSIRLLNDQIYGGPSSLIGVTEKGFLFRYVLPYCPMGNPVCGYDPDEIRLDSVNLVNKRGVITETSVAKLPAAEAFVRASSGSISVGSLPFGKKPFFAHKDGLLYAGWNGAIAISVISEDGDVLKTIKREYQAIPVTRREVEDIVSDFSEETRKAILKRYASIPETKPAYDALVVDDQGHVWIREYPDTGKEFAKWFILDSDSKLIGEMELPTNLLLKTITRDRAYASVNSEMYGPYIVVYEITE